MSAQPLQKLQQFKYIARSEFPNYLFSNIAALYNFLAKLSRRGEQGFHHSFAWLFSVVNCFDGVIQVLKSMLEVSAAKRIEQITSLFDQICIEYPIRIEIKKINQRIF